MLQEPIKFDTEKFAIDILTENMKITRNINKQYVGPKGNIINTIENETSKIADVQFIKDVVDILINNSKNLEEFIDKLGELVIYITPDLDDITFGLFKTDIEMNKYTPEKLLSLTQKEKMPEIFSDNFLPIDKREKIREMINYSLEKNLKEFREDFVDTLYIRRNPYTHYKQRRNIRQPVDRFNKENFPEDWRLKCENVYNSKRNIDKNELNKIPKNALGFYINYTDPEDNKTYCLNIYEIGARIDNNDNTNPHTNKPLPLDFIEKIKKLNEAKKKEEIIEEKPEKQKIQIGHLTPGLLDIIRNDINRLIDLKSTIKTIDSGPHEDGYNEKLLFLNDEIDEILNSDGYSSSGEDFFMEEDGHHEENEEEDEYNEEDDEHNEFEEDEHEEGEENENEDEDNGINILQNEDIIHEDDNYGGDDYTIDDTDNDSVIEFSDFDYDLDSVIPEICKYCSNDITDKKYKSILWNGKGIDNVVFCSIKCIENFDWKRHKCKIKKKKN